MKIEVTLTSSDNEYIAHPCVGLLDIIEMGTHKKILVAVFHAKKEDGSYGPPVRVRDIQFSYS